MLEVIDYSSKLKLMSMVVGSIEYKKDKYVIYCIDRGSGEANIFVSKLVVSSDGFVFNNDFDNGEKEMLDGLIKRVINKEDIGEDGFIISSVNKFNDSCYFDIEKCYVATINKRVIKEVMVHYKLVNKNTFDRPIVEIKEDKRVFNEGFVGNIFLIIFGLVVIVFCVVVLVGVIK